MSSAGTGQSGRGGPAGGDGPSSGTSVDFGPSPDDPLSARLFPPLPGTVKWGLERTRRILAGVGHPLRTTPILHVGGTNGKGTVAWIWASILREAGLRVGLYTSPDLISFRERILVEGRPLSDLALEAAADELRPLLLREDPSRFEAATALAFLALERARVEVAVVEVGLGGRLDATNVVEPLVTAITNVGLEHRSLLGRDMATIAREKAGILKPGVPAYSTAREADVLEVLTREAATLGAPLIRVPEPSGTLAMEGITVSLPTRRWGRLELTSPLVGRHHFSNVALAVRSLEGLPPRIAVGAEEIRRGVAAVRIPGRFQVEWEGKRLWVLDVAHNAAAAEALASTLDRVAAPRPRVGVVGILADKDHAAVLSRLAPALDAVVLTTPSGVHSSRVWNPGEARTALPSEMEVHIEPDVGQALDRARELMKEGATGVVTGSFRLVGEALQVMGRVPPEALPPSSDFE